MSLEIELKAWIDDPKSFTKTLEAKAHSPKTFFKKDIYYESSVDRKRGFRLRDDNGVSIITHKIKKIEGGVETSQENEFTVSDMPAFIRMMEDLGYTAGQKKVKVGSSWLLEDAVIDFSLVEDLGHFVEVELLLLIQSSNSEIEIAKKKLTKILSHLEIDSSKIESTPYTTLLRQKLIS